MFLLIYKHFSILPCIALVFCFVVLVIVPFYQYQFQDLNVVDIYVVVFSIKEMLYFHTGFNVVGFLNYLKINTQLLFQM